MNNPLLSVCLITYNHINYIREAIDGVLMQKVNFSWDLIIADDYSTDGTREVIIEYMNKHPRLVKLILQEKNVGAAKNWMDLINAPTGKYIAYFEGDDYWTDPNKLQKQVDFLEANLDYSICWTKATYYYTANKQFVPESFVQLLYHKTYYTIDLNSYYDKYCALTVTTVFVASKLARFNLKKFSYVNDSVLFFILLSQGKGALLNFDSAVYRIHSLGLWNGASNYAKKVNYFYALDAAIKMIPQLASIDHLVNWRKWNLTQAFYLMAESFSRSDFKIFVFLFYKILNHQNRVEKKKAIKTFLKTLVFKR